MQVGIVLGSRYQLATMQHTAKLLANLGIAHEVRIITANKGSKRLHEYASKAVDRGLEIIIAGPTKKAYLPGIIASKTEIPVLGIQANSSTNNKNICDSNSDNKNNDPIRMFNAGPEGAVSAALFAARTLSTKYPHIHDNLMKYRNQNERRNASQVNSRHIV